MDSVSVRAKRIIRTMALSGRVDADLLLNPTILHLIKEIAILQLNVESLVRTRNHEVDVIEVDFRVIKDDEKP